MQCHFPMLGNILQLVFIDDIPCTNVQLLLLFERIGQIGKAKFFSVMPRWTFLVNMLLNLFFFFFFLANPNFQIGG